MPISIARRMRRWSGETGGRLVGGTDVRVGVLGRSRRRCPIAPNVGDDGDRDGCLDSVDRNGSERCHDRRIASGGVLSGHFGADHDRRRPRHWDTGTRQRRCLLRGVEPVRRHVAGVARGFVIPRRSRRCVPLGDRRVAGRRHRLRRSARQLPRRAGSRGRHGRRRVLRRAGASVGRRRLPRSAATGATADQVDRLAASWLAALAVRDPASPDIGLELPADLIGVVDEAAAAFRSQRTEFGRDPSMVIGVATPLTDSFLETACPDQGALTGQEIDGG